MRELTQQEIDNAPDWATHYYVMGGGNLMYESLEFWSFAGVATVNPNLGIASSSKPITRKPFDIGEYDDETDGIHPNDSPCIEIIDGELRVSGIIQECHAIAIAKHFKLI